MKKIMFNDKYGLTEAVLNGNKTQTRRIVKVPKSFKGIDVCGFHKYTNKDGEWFTSLYDEDEQDIDGTFLPHTYQFGEIVAVAQSYKTIFNSYQTSREYADSMMKISKSHPDFIPEKVFGNKMFVRPEFMPYKIQITDVRLQRLQDITDEECLAEGIREQTCRYLKSEERIVKYTSYIDDRDFWNTPKAAYAYLIDKISGVGTWHSNPWVFAYTFELIK